MDLTQPLTTFAGGSDAALARWTFEMGQAFPPLSIAGTDRSFVAGLRSIGVPDFRFLDMTVSPHHVTRRSGRGVAAGDGFFKVTLQLDGHGVMTQGDRESELAPGTIAVWDTGRDYQLRLGDNFRFLVAMFPKAVVHLPPGLVGELTAIPIPSDSGMANVVAAFLRALGENLDRLQGPSGQGLARAGLDLFSTLFSEELDLAAPGGDPARRSLTTEVCHYVNRHLGDADLSIAGIAAAFFVSPRYVHGLFEGRSSGGLAHWIKQRRLEECRRELTDPRHDSTPIAVIARRWGLTDGAYFSRVFREAFGDSPSGWRRRHQAMTR